MTEANPPAPGATLVVDAGDEAIADSDPYRRRVIIARTALCCGTLAVWQIAVATGLIDPLWVSSPWLVAMELWRLITTGELLIDVRVTVSEALIAFVVSSVLGIASGLLLARSPFWDEVLAPVIVALNSLPRIALAPLIILWFGIGVLAKVVTAFTLVYFILLVNTLSGAKNIDTDIMTIAQLDGRLEARSVVEGHIALGLAVDIRGAQHRADLFAARGYRRRDPGLEPGTGLSDRQQRRQFRHRGGVRRAGHTRRHRLAVQHSDAQDRGVAAALETFA